MSVALMFPGQGSQRVGMGQRLYARHAEARAVFDRASAALDRDLVGLCFRGSTASLQLTTNAQVAVFVVNAAANAVLAERHIPVGCVAGHSVGELSALLAAGVVDLETGCRLVHGRARIMAKARAEGAMLAVSGLPESELQRVCDECAHLGPIVIGLHNAPEAFVLSGAVAAVEAASDACRARGAKAMTRLRTENAFHSPLMTPIVAEWEDFVAPIALHAPVVPVLLNTTARPTLDIAEIRRALVAQQTSRVRWCETIVGMREMGARVLIETGDSKVCSVLARAVDRTLTTITLSDPGGLERFERLLSNVE